MVARVEEAGEGHQRRAVAEPDLRVDRARPEAAHQPGAAVQLLAIGLQGRGQAPGQRLQRRIGEAPRDLGPRVDAMRDEGENEKDHRAAAGGGHGGF